MIFPNYHVKMQLVYHRVFFGATDKVHKDFSKIALNYKKVPKALKGLLLNPFYTMFYERI